MKKILSMLLVLTMIVTTFMGVMIVDVSAGVNTAVNKDETPRVWTLTYTTASTSAKQIMATGKYILKPETVAEDGQASYELGEISSATVLGMAGYHFNFNGFTFKNGTAGLDNSYTRLQTMYSDAAANAAVDGAVTLIFVLGQFFGICGNKAKHFPTPFCFDYTALL